MPTPCKPCGRRRSHTLADALVARVLPCDGLHRGLRRDARAREGLKAQSTVGSPRHSLSVFSGVLGPHWHLVPTEAEIHDAPDAIPVMQRLRVALYRILAVHLGTGLTDQKRNSMNITGLGSPTLAALNGTTSNQTTKTKSSIPPAMGSAATSNISKPAELLQKLQQLQQQDPAKFKQVASQLADGLEKVAAQSGNSNGLAANLASALKSAADSGDLSSVQAALTPPPRPNAAPSAKNTQGAQSTQGHHHGHYHGGAAVASALSSAIGQIDAALQASSAKATPTETNTAATTAAEASIGTTTT